MKYVNYKFERHLKNLNSNFIYQTVKNRKLSDVYHSHDFYEFIVIIDGDCTQTVNEQEILCDKNTVIFLCPGDRHKFTKQSDNLNLMALSIAAEEINRFEKLFGIEASPFEFSITKLSSKQIQPLISLYYSKSEYEFKLLLANFTKIYTDAFTQSSSLPKNVEKAVTQMYAAENLKGGTDRFVELSGYSRTHLNRLLKEHLKVTPHEFILNLRLSEAYNALILTDTRIEDICANLGYESFSHFQKIFKAKYGITPAAVRKKYGSATI